MPIRKFTDRLVHGLSSTTDILFPLASMVAVVITAAPLYAADKLEGEKQVVDSKADDLPIHFTYFPADEEKLESGDGLDSAPVVILIHGQKEDRLVWENKPTNFQKRPMTQVLADLGFAIVTVDMRGHGESVLPDGKSLNPTDYPKMLGDLEAVKSFLMEEHQKKQLNINKLGIVAADEMTPVALQYTSYDWQKPDYDDAPTPSRRTPRGRDVRALALLSPAPQAGSVRTMSAMSFLRDKRIEMGVLLATGTEDPLDKGLTKRIGRQFRVDTADDDDRLLESYETRLRGSALIGAEKIRTDLHLKLFLEKTLREVDVPWRNRESRVAR